MGRSSFDVNSRNTLLVPSSLSATTLLEPTATPITNINPLNVLSVDSTGTATGVDCGKVIQSKQGVVSSSGNNTLLAAGTNRLKVFAFSLSSTSDTEVVCIFQSGASGTGLWRVVLQSPTSVAGGANLAVNPPAWLFATGTATLLNLNLSAAVSVHWSVSYYDEA